ncbi:MAG: hypothetical protein LC737_08070, partial [Chloroflexi bacterium]|nr:hypothetical protein [Chloroflexota bacterium]
MQALSERADLYPAERIGLIKQLKWFAQRQTALTLGREITNRQQAEEIRGEALRSLCEMASPDAYSILNELLQSVDGGERTWLVSMLNRIHHPMAHWLLRSADLAPLESPDAESPGDMQPDQIPALLEQGRGADANLRQRAVEDLQRVRLITSPTVIEQIIYVALNGCADQRAIAADLLGRVPSTANAPPLDIWYARRLLSKLLDDTDSARRWIAYRVLKVCAPVAIYKDCVRILERHAGPESLVRRALVDILATRPFLCAVMQAGARLDAVKV